MSDRRSVFGGMETTFSRWVARLVKEHLILGSLFESAFMATWIAILAFILSGEDVGKTVGTWIVLFVGFFVWFGIYNFWKLARRP
jgi:hypothetical protein